MYVWEVRSLYSTTQRATGGFEDMTDRIQAYDSHCNLVLGDVEEIIYQLDEEEESEEVKVERQRQFVYAGINKGQTIKKKLDMLFVRGTGA